jgi:hypothetical protein
MRLKLVCLFSAVLLALPCVAQNALTYTAIPDVPGSTGGNRANGINPRGDIVGHYNDSTGRHGYLFAKGSAGPTPIDFSTAPFNSSGGTSARGINARGDIVGDYIDGSNVDHGYLLSNGVFTSVDATSLGAVATVARGLNNAGKIVGDYTDSAGKLHGFFLSMGVFQTIDFPLSPGFAQTRVAGIADDDIMVGTYLDASEFAHGFRRSSAGVFTSITDSAASDTVGRGINAEGDIVGSHANAADLTGEKIVGSNGFLLRAGDLIDFIAIDFPATGVKGTQARGVNPRGDVVGAYVDSSGADHGFIATR